MPAWSRPFHKVGRLWRRLLVERRALRNLLGFARMLPAAAEEEIGCDEVHALMDQYAEIVASGQDPRALLPLVHHHLSICGDCREELEALLRAIEGT